jgi:uncharacterized membrane protein required for colicin V production
VLVVVWAGITLAGFFKGAIRIVFGVGGLALGVWLSVVTGPDLVAVVGEVVHQSMLAAVIAYAVPWLLVTLFCAVAGWGMEKALDALKLGCLNRVLGAVLAGSAAAVVLALLLVTAVRLSPGLAAVGERSVVLARARAVLGADAEPAPVEPRDTDVEDAGPPAETEPEPTPAT